MTVLATERLTNYAGLMPARGTYPIRANVRIFKGALVCLDTAGRAMPGGLASGGARGAVGKASATYDNRTGSVLGGAAGAVDVEVEFGTYQWANSAGGDAIAADDVGKLCFVVDDQTVALTSDSDTRVIGGVITEIIDSKPYVWMGPHVSGIASVAFFDGFHGFSLNDFREVDGSGDVGNIAANGGLLASDTTPILRGSAAESFEIFWATGNVDPIALHITLPADFDGASNVTVDLWVRSGATDAATFTVESGWDDGALVSDSASDAATKSATLHKITATIAAADIPNTARLLTLALTPTNAHATDAYSLLGCAINFTRVQA
jgi:hypothetical protein